MKTSPQQRMQFLDLYTMVMADGIAHPKEMETLYRIGTENYGLTLDEINGFIKDAGSSSSIPELPEDRISLLYEMALIAWADGELEDSEKKLLHRYAIRFQVNEENVDALVSYLLDKAKSNTPEELVINELKKQ